MAIRKALYSDLPEILRIYARARQYMAQNGNPTQWGTAYPSFSMLEEDISLGQLYLGEDEAGTPRFVFMFRLGDDPSYAAIDGKWLNDLPYGTIHRLASDGVLKDVFSSVLKFCLGLSSNIRADTHQDNLIMQRLLERGGFSRCGIIICEHDNIARIAYQICAK